jgi:hypothetical protein
LGVEQLRDSEIGELHHGAIAGGARGSAVALRRRRGAVLDEHVFRFDVPVDHPRGMRVGEGRQELERDARRDLDRHCTTHLKHLA